MHGGAVDGALEDVLGEDRLVAVVEVNDAEDLIAKPAKAGLDVAPGVGRRSERPVASQPGLHPPCMEFVQSVDASAVLGGQGNGAQPVGGVVEELAQAPCGGQSRDIDVDADEAEELVVVEGGGTRALDAGEQRLGGWRRRSRRGIGRGRLGPHRGGERGFVWHGGSVVDKAGSGRVNSSPIPRTAPLPGDPPTRAGCGERSGDGSRSGGAAQVEVAGRMTPHRAVAEDDGPAAQQAGPRQMEAMEV